MKQKRLPKGCEKWHPGFQVVEENAQENVLKLLQISSSYSRAALKPGQQNLRETLLPYTSKIKLSALLQCCGAPDPGGGIIRHSTGSRFLWLMSNYWVELEHNIGYSLAKLLIMWCWTISLSPMFPSHTSLPFPAKNFEKESTQLDA